MRSVSRATTFALTLCFVLLTATTAFAAPTSWERVDVRLLSEDSGGVLIVSGQLPGAASLPAEGELAVPKGALLQWIGEILGGSPSEDPKVEYQKATEGETDVYRFTMAQARTAQIEVRSPADRSDDGVNYTSSMSWTASQDIPEVSLSARIPESATIVQTAEGAVAHRAEAGNSYYGRTFEDVKAGDELTLEFTYSMPPVGQVTSSASAGAGSSSAAIVVLVAVFAIAVAFGAFAVGRKTASRRLVQVADDDSGEEWDSGAFDSDEPAEASDGDAPAARDDAVNRADDAEIEAPRQRRSGGSSVARVLVIAVIVGIFGIAIALIGAEMGRPKITGDSISQTFAQGEPCAFLDVAVVAGDGVDPRDTAAELFEALKPMDGLNNATYDLKTSVLKVGYCESQTTPDAIRSSLAPTGLVSEGDAQ